MYTVIANILGTYANDRCMLMIMDLHLHMRIYVHTYINVCKNVNL